MPTSGLSYPKFAIECQVRWLMDPHLRKQIISQTRGHQMIGQRKIELIVGAALIVGVASYSWIYHFSKDDSQVMTLAETVLDEASELSGLKVDQSDFTETALPDPFTHLSVNGDTWFSQTTDGFESGDVVKNFQLLPEIEIPEEAWYSPSTFAATWTDFKEQISSYFSESE